MMTQEELDQVLRHPTTTVPIAGRALGVGSKDTSYAAAARGEIKTIRVGRLLRVPTKWLREQLEGA